MIPHIYTNTQYNIMYTAAYTSSQHMILQFNTHKRDNLRAHSNPTPP